ncbi:uncharacterized protein A4U43_C01F16420 [Asparagus officinalis]|uniref:Major facilitator superfamily (MFS) profile domain-containing protein n=1 Tax=Asparagus officinalis TaxID=4686 RepID=A0A5P1FSB6_ASPOF|nr:uncharacterized protein A4U43_C01F16420 [Asparagus officinalis]
MENLAFLANASNLVTYLMAFMHLSPSRSANSVTNFMGTSFLLALLGGFLSDAFLSSYHIYLISALIEFLGLVILTIQAKSSSLKPPPCAPTDPNAPCQQVSGNKATMLFAGLYLTALGVGGIKGSLPAHGAEQFDEETVDGRKNRSTFFNYFVFCLSLGGLIAVTLVVWVEDNKGWQWGFGISTLTILLSVPSFVAGSAFYRNKVPIGSPLTTIAKVLVASLLSCNSAQSPSSAVADLASNPIPAQMKGKEEQVLVASISSCNSAQSPSSAVADLASNPIPAQMKGKEERAPNEAQKQVFGRLSDDLQFLNRATQPKPICSGLTCTAEQVEDVKIVIKIVPIFFSTIMLSCCLAQLNTFSVQQARTMDTRVGSLADPLARASAPDLPRSSSCMIPRRRCLASLRHHARYFRRRHEDREAPHHPPMPEESGVRASPVGRVAMVVRAVL